MQRKKYFNILGLNIIHTYFRCNLITYFCNIFILADVKKVVDKYFYFVANIFYIVYINIQLCNNY